MKSVYEIEKEIQKQKSALDSNYLIPYVLVISKDYMQKIFDDKFDNKVKLHNQDRTYYDSMIVFISKNKNEISVCGKLK